MENNKIVLRGVSISREVLEEKYQLTFSDIEWKVFSSKLVNSWNTDEESLRKLVFTHIKKSMADMGFKLALSNDTLAFKK